MKGAQTELNLLRIADVRWTLLPGAARVVVPLPGGFVPMEALIANPDARDLLGCWS